MGVWHKHPTSDPAIAFQLDSGPDIDLANPEHKSSSSFAILWMFCWCLWSLSCCMIHFQPGFNFTTDSLSLCSRVLEYSSEFMVLWTMWSCPGPAGAAASSFSRCSLEKLRQAALFFFDNRGFVLATLPCKSCWLSFLLIVETCAWFPDAARKVCKSLDVMFVLL